MYNIKLYDYVPEPKPATSDCIVAAHCYAAWKKGAAQIHGGFDDLHDYPERTPLMGYYDEENPAVCDWEIKWASEHGINCFIHCWYRLKENQGKPVTPSDLRCGHGLHDAMFNARYQKYMKFAIMYEAQTRWGGTDSKDIIDNLMPFWTENYFKRENYLKIDNKPVLFVYDTKNQIRDAFPEPDDQKKAFDACREYAVRAGFDGMIFSIQSTAVSEVSDAEYRARGYDFIFGYSSGYSPTEDYPDDAAIIDGQLSLLEKRLALDPMRHIATITCFRDPTPRFTHHWLDMGFAYKKWNRIWYLSPNGYRTLLRKMKEKSDALPDGAWGRRIFMIDNWNEWDEGHFVAPSHGYGFKYLQAIREELTHRDNLPDYRMPQDICPSDYNKSWDIPDFTGVKRKDFYVNE